MLLGAFSFFSYTFFAGGKWRVCADVCGLVTMIMWSNVAALDQCNISAMSSTKFGPVRGLIGWLLHSLRGYRLNLLRIWRNVVFASLFSPSSFFWFPIHHGTRIPQNQQPMCFIRPFFSPVFSFSWYHFRYQIRLRWSRRGGLNFFV